VLKIKRIASKEQSQVKGVRADALFSSKVSCCWNPR